MEVSEGSGSTEILLDSPQHREPLFITRAMLTTHWDGLLPGRISRLCHMNWVIIYRQYICIANIYINWSTHSVGLVVIQNIIIVLMCDMAWAQSHAISCSCARTLLLYWVVSQNTIVWLFLCYTERNVNELEPFSTFFVLHRTQCKAMHFERERFLRHNSNPNP